MFLVLVNNKIIKAPSSLETTLNESGEFRKIRITQVEKANLQLQAEKAELEQKLLESQEVQIHLESRVEYLQGKCNHLSNHIRMISDLLPIKHNHSLTEDLDNSL